MAKWQCLSKIAKSVESPKTIELDHVMPDDVLGDVGTCKFGGFHKWGIAKMDGLQWKVLLKLMI